MKNIIIVILALITFLGVRSDPLNEFSGDVDYYDLGGMGRGKNAGSWQHSYEGGYDIFYYLAMQPWRHFVWTRKEGDTWVKKIMNEDNNVNSFTNLDSQPSQDFCQKEYGYPIQKFEIDWMANPTDTSHLKAVNVNGIVCYQYTAKSPLAYVLLSKKLNYDTRNELYD
ncbi:Gal/galnac lectin heavy subunit, partial [Entamoeba invadens IP1]